MFRPSTGALHTSALPYSSNPKGRAQTPKPSRSTNNLTIFDDTPLAPDNTASVLSPSSNDALDKPKRPMTSTTTNNMFPSFLDNPPSTSTPPPTSNHTPSSSTGSSSIPRSAPQQGPQPQQQQQMNGGGGPGMNGATNGIGSAAGGSNGIAGAGAMGPMNAGQQMDVNFLWQKVLELSEVLRENRERTRGVVEGAEELATRAASSSSPPSSQEANSSARIATLEHQLHLTHLTLSTLTRENRANTLLIGDYETALGSVVEMVRNYAYNQNQASSTLATHYNKLLQEEKDAHLEARLEGGVWFERYERVVEMLREGYRRACEEEGGSVRVVRGLQEEVRALRKVLGMGEEAREEEGGWEVLRGEGEEVEVGE